tara:strand:+ start:356 stop:607 length:252 start_codon:yes stop_codon:yes gene_type:complete
MIVETYDLPSDWAGYLINGDSTGFSLNDDGGESEIKLIEKFLHESDLQGALVDCSEESFFSKYHDAHLYGVLACTCSTFNFYK